MSRQDEDRMKPDKTLGRSREKGYPDLRQCGTAVQNSRLRFEPLLSSVITAETLGLSEPQFPCLKIGNDRVSLCLGCFEDEIE